MKQAFFASGCFWCITPTFKDEEGVVEVYAGYCGGDEENPTYLEVKQQKTGHRESILIDYDENKISYEKLIDIYLNNVDPFDGGGQFIDRGHSYTLAVYYQSYEEKELIEQKISVLEQQSQQKCAIAIEPLKKFYLAEEYHQNYYLKHPKEFEEELVVSGRKQR